MHPILADVMMPHINITVDNKKVLAALDKVEKELHDLTPAMRKIAGTLAYEAERNFAEQGRPKWPSLSGATKNARIKRMGAKGAAKQRKGEGIKIMILQDSGQLAGEISTDYGRDFAVVGSNKEYAAIHQLGGQAGRGKKVTIPARPYLPFLPNGELQPAAENAVLDTILDHLKTAVK
jgi:phage virion morphogenesis protein